MFEIACSNAKWFEHVWTLSTEVLPRLHFCWALDWGVFRCSRCTFNIPGHRRTGRCWFRDPQAVRFGCWWSSWGPQGPNAQMVSRVWDALKQRLGPGMHRLGRSYGTYRLSCLLSYGPILFKWGLWRHHAPLLRCVAKTWSFCQCFPAADNAGALTNDECRRLLRRLSRCPNR